MGIMLILRQRSDVRWDPCLFLVGPQRQALLGRRVDDRIGAATAAFGRSIQFLGLLPDNKNMSREPNGHNQGNWALDAINEEW